MIDTSSFLDLPVGLLLDNTRLECIAVATDSFFEDISGGRRHQIADLDVELSDNFLDYAVIGLDIGGIAISGEVKARLIEGGSAIECFRNMSVNGEIGRFWQFVADGTFELLNDLPSAPGSETYLGPLDDIDLLIKPLDDSVVGTLLGRESYQELVFLPSAAQIIENLGKGSKEWLAIPLYDRVLQSIVNERWEQVSMDDGRFGSKAYLEILRSHELLAALKYSKFLRNLQLSERIYSVIKNSKVSLQDKKMAMMVYKKI